MEGRLRVLILGADGFIGRHLAFALDGAEWAQPIRAGRRAIAEGPGARVQVDATDEQALDGALAGVDAVVSCIAGTAQDIVHSARALAALGARAAQPPLLIHLSSMAVYGGVAGAVDESAPPCADENAYARAKIEAERVLGQHPRAVHLRPGIVYGPGSALWTDFIGRLLLQRRIGDLGAAGRGRCNVVYVADVVAAVLQLLRSPVQAGRVFNLAAPAPPTWNEYFDRFASALHVVPSKRIGSARLAAELWLAGPLLVAAQRLARAAGADPALVPPAIRPWLLALCSQGIELSSQRAESELGLRWTLLDDGLQRSARWLLHRGQTGEFEMTRSAL